MITRISSDLISYQNGGKGCIVVAGYIGRTNEYATMCMDMHRDGILISA